FRSNVFSNHLDVALPIAPNHDRTLCVCFQHDCEDVVVLRAVTLGQLASANEEGSRESIAASGGICHDRHAADFLRRPTGARIDDMTEPSSVTLEKLFFSSTRR